MIVSSVRKRSYSPELLGLPPESYSQTEFNGTLTDIRKVNRFLGDTHAVLKYFSTFLSDIKASPSRPVKVLDVATGSAGISAAIVMWVRRHGKNVVVNAVDITPLTILKAAAFAQTYTRDYRCRRRRLLTSVLGSELRYRFVHQDYASFQRRGHGQGVKKPFW
jgi:hypothetical protein